MKILLRVALFATAAVMATAAQAGNGDLFLTSDECLANLNTAQPYQPALVSSRARLSKPMNGWKAIGGEGRACALEKTGIKSFRGTSRAPDSPWDQGFWVVIERAYVVRNSSGQLADLRCFNPIAALEVPRQETANVVRPVAQPRQRGSTIVYYQQNQEAQVSYQPVPIYLPAPLPPSYIAGINSVAVAFGGNSNNYYQGQPANTPPFGGVTNPPNTNVPLPGPVFNGNTSTGTGSVPAPIFNGNTGNGVPYPTSNGNYNGGVRPPNYNGGNNGVPVPIYGGTFVGNTGVPSPVTGNYNNGVQPPNYNGGNIIYNNGVSAPVFGGGNNNGTFNGSTGNGNSFGGFTAAPLPAPVFGGGNNGNTFGGSTGNGGGTIFTPIPGPINGTRN